MRIIFIVMNKRESKKAKMIETNICSRFVCGALRSKTHPDVTFIN